MIPLQQPMNLRCWWATKARKLTGSCARNDEKAPRAAPLLIKLFFLHPYKKPTRFQRISCRLFSRFSPQKAVTLHTKRHRAAAKHHAPKRRGVKKYIVLGKNITFSFILDIKLTKTEGVKLIKTDKLFWTILTFELVCGTITLYHIYLLNFIFFVRFKQNAQSAQEQC